MFGRTNLASNSPRSVIRNLIALLILGNASTGTVVNTLIFAGGKFLAIVVHASVLIVNHPPITTILLFCIVSYKRTLGIEVSVNIPLEICILDTEFRIPLQRAWNIKEV